MDNTTMPQTSVPAPGFYVHFSVDDVGRSLRCLASSKPSSIFDMRFFGRLRDWNLWYGVKVSLYAYAMYDGFSICDIPDDYADELHRSGDWLRFGYHSKCNTPFVDEPEYKESFQLVGSALARLGAGTTDILRLHCWHASPEQKDWLAKSGVSELLYPDDSGLFGNGDIFEEMGILHRRTRVRFEKLGEITPESLHVGLPRVYAFTHEWCLIEQAPRIEAALKLYSDNGYAFV